MFVNVTHLTKLSQNFHCHLVPYLNCKTPNLHLQTFQANRKLANKLITKPHNPPHPAFEFLIKRLRIGWVYTKVTIDGVAVKLLD